MRIYLLTLLDNFTRAGKEVITMANNLEDQQPGRLRDAIVSVCDWVLRKMPGAVIWMIVRHIIRAKIGFHLDF